MWFPLREVANFAMLMGALIAIAFIGFASDYLLYKMYKWFKEKKFSEKEN